MEGEARCPSKKRLLNENRVNHACDLIRKINLIKRIDEKVLGKLPDSVGNKMIGWNFTTRSLELDTIKDDVRLEKLILFRYADGIFSGMSNCYLPQTVVADLFSISKISFQFSRDYQWYIQFVDFVPHLWASEILRWDAFNESRYWIRSHDCDLIHLKCYFFSFELNSRSCFDDCAKISLNKQQRKKIKMFRYSNWH